MTETIFTRTIIRRPDYWECYQWQICDGKRQATLLFFPHSKNCPKTRHSRWTRCGWKIDDPIRNVSGNEIKKFFRWWRQGSFEMDMQ